MKIIPIAIAVLTLTLLPLSLQAAASKPSADAIYQEAVFQETTTRDLEGAIQLYQKTLQQPDVSSNLQSNAYLRMGLCYRTLGNNELAKEAWNKVIQDFADQRTVYQEARDHLRELELEAGKAAPVQPSTPTVKVIYAIPQTRMEFQLIRLGYIPSSTRNGFLGIPSLAYFYKANRAIGVEGLVWSEEFQVSDNPSPSESLQVVGDTGYLAVAVTHLWEKPIGNQFRPYVKVGPGMYETVADTLEGHTQKWSPGVLTEVGATIGWSRGFIFNMGYVLNTFYQPSVAGLMGSSIRGVHGALFALGYRW